MGIYTEHLVPRLINFAMRGEQFQKLRRDLVGQARGQVLEVGIGSGLNLPHYGAAVDHVTGIDPSETGLVLAEQQAKISSTQVELIQGSAEQIPLPDASFDSVVSTWTLCSVPSVEAVIAEIYRVLKPGGRFYFIEHGLADDPTVVKWQGRLTPMMKACAGGCHLNRPIDKQIAASTFHLNQIETGYLLPGPRPFVHNFLGEAVKS